MMEGEIVDKVYGSNLWESNADSCENKFWK